VRNLEAEYLPRQMKYEEQEKKLAGRNSYARTEEAIRVANDATRATTACDTSGGVYGQMTGAHYGATGIPQKWVAKLR